MPSITLSAELNNLMAFLEFICENAQAHHLKTDQIAKLRLVSEEALVNIINFAFKKDKTGDIKVDCVLDKNDEFLVEVRDQGVEFNLLDEPKPDLDSPLEDRKAGGLGIFFISELTDRVDYKREGNTNVLTFVMNVDS